LTLFPYTTLFRSYSPNFWARFFRMPPPLQATTAPARLTEPGPLAESAAPATPA
jgi:hypothetical protein